MINECIKLNTNFYFSLITICIDELLQNLVHTIPLSPFISQ